MKQVVKDRKADFIKGQDYFKILLFLLNNIGPVYYFVLEMLVRRDVYQHTLPAFCYLHQEFSLPEVFASVPVFILISYFKHLTLNCRII